MRGSVAPAIVHDPEREPLVVTDEDPVRAGSATCPLEQPSSEVGPVAEAAPGRRVTPARVEQDGAVARPVARIEPSQQLPGDGHAVDPVRQGATDELASCAAKGRMTPRSDAEREMVPARRRGREDPDPRDALQVQMMLRSRLSTMSDCASPERVERLGRRRGGAGLAAEAEHEAIEMGDVRPPVTGVADERELPAALPALNEEGATSDGATSLRVDDLVGPDAGGDPHPPAHAQARLEGTGCASRAIRERRTTCTVFVPSATDRAHLEMRVWRSRRPEGSPCG